MDPWPGFFISFEGLDGAGKSTQVASLAAALRARRHDVVTVRPNSTLLGEILHSFVLQHQRGPAVEPWAEALLFNAERVQLLKEIVLPALQRGAVVIADRYADSTLAYQGGGRGIPVDALMQLHREACDDVWPDLTIYLEIPPSLAAERQRDQQLPLDRIEGAPYDFHAAVRRTFNALAAAYPERIVRVDASRAAVDVAHDIASIVLQPPAVGHGHPGRARRRSALTRRRRRAEGDEVRVLPRAGPLRSPELAPAGSAPPASPPTSSPRIARRRARRPRRRRRAPRGCRRGGRERPGCRARPAPSRRRRGRAPRPRCAPGAGGGRR